MNQRTIDALRNLAERPGTEAERKLAREILARVGTVAGDPTPEDVWALMDRLAKVPLGDEAAQVRARDEFAEALRKRDLWEHQQPLPTHWPCDCGAMLPVGIHPACWNQAEHSRVQSVAAKRFPKGTRVCYNYRAYKINATGVSTGHQSDWNWMRVKFDHLKSARNVPIYSAKGWHLSIEPVDEETYKRLYRP